MIARLFCAITGGHEWRAWSGGLICGYCGKVIRKALP